MLAAYLTWHLRKAWAPLTYTDEHPPARDNPVAPATAPPPPPRKASRPHNDTAQPVRRFRDLLEHLATLTRNDIRYGTDPTPPARPTLTQATPEQHTAFTPIKP